MSKNENKIMVSLNGNMVDVETLSPAQMRDSLSHKDKLIAFKHFGFPITDEMLKNVEKEKISSVENMAVDINKIVSNYPDLDISEKEILSSLKTLVSVKSGSDVSALHSLAETLIDKAKLTTINEFTPVSKTVKNVSGTKIDVSVSVWKPKNISVEKKYASLKGQVISCQGKVNTINDKKAAGLTPKGNAEQNAINALKKAQKDLEIFEKENAEEIKALTA